MLTAKQKKDYIQTEPGLCPYCKSGQIDTEPISFEATDLEQDARCITCGQTWTDVYKLVDVLSV